MSEVEISIVIPCYNRWSFLPNVIESIFSQTFKNWEIILIDDASDIAHNDIIQDARIEYLRLDQRKGSGHARNIGAAHSKGKFVLFVDDDMTLDPKYLENLLRIYKQKTDAGAVGGRLIYVHKRKFFDPNIFYDTPVKVGNLSGEVLGGFDRKTVDIVEVPVLHVVSLFKKEEFLSIGGFDETTYVGNRYREETDLFYRIRQTGSKLYFDPNTFARHFDIKSGGQRSNLMKTEFYVLLNHKRFLKKFYPNRCFLMMTCFVVRRFYDRTAQLFNKTTKVFRFRSWGEIGEDTSNEV